MVPTTWLSIVFFVLLIAPGLLFDLLAERRRVGPEESIFREISRVVLASVVFSTLGLVVVGLIRARRPAWMPDPGELLARPHQYLVTHYRLILRALVIEAVAALGIAGVVHWLLARRHGSRLRPLSSWWRVFKDDAPTGTVPHARIKLTNGTVYVGKVAHYTADLGRDDREIVLARPLFSKAAPKDGAKTSLKEMPVEWQRLILPASAIESISVQYRPGGQAAKPSPPSRVRAVRRVRRSRAKAG